MDHILQITSSAFEVVVDPHFYNTRTVVRGKAFGDLRKSVTQNMSVLCAASISTAMFRNEFKSVTSDESRIFVESDITTVPPTHNV